MMVCSSESVLRGILYWGTLYYKMEYVCVCVCVCVRACVLPVLLVPSTVRVYFRTPMCRHFSDTTP